MGAVALARPDAEARGDRRAPSRSTTPQPHTWVPGSMPRTRRGFAGASTGRIATGGCAPPRHGSRAGSRTCLCRAPRSAGRSLRRRLAIPARLRGRTEARGRRSSLTPRDDRSGPTRSRRCASGLELYGPGLPRLRRGALRARGRPTLVRGLLDEMHRWCALPSDRVYVNNFRHPERPRLLELPRGRGAGVREGGGEGGRAAGGEDPPARARTRPTRSGARTLTAASREEERTLVDAFEKACADRGFTRASVADGNGTEPDVFWVGATRSVHERPRHGDPRRKVRARRGRGEDPRRARELRARADRHAAQASAGSRASASARLDDLERSVAHRLLDEDVTSDLHARVPGSRRSRRTSRRRSAHFIDALRGLRAGAARGRRGDGGAVPDTYRLAARGGPARVPASTSCSTRGRRRLPDRRRGPAHVDEPLRPGRARDATRDGGVRTRLPDDPAGQPAPRRRRLPRAAGARTSLAEEGVWQELKRVLQGRRLEIRCPRRVLPTSPTVLHPDPIPVNVKVVLIGDEGTWYALREADPDFADIFKVKAVFERDTPLDARSLAPLRRASCAASPREEGRLPLDRDGARGAGGGGRARGGPPGADPRAVRAHRRPRARGRHAGRRTGAPSRSRRRTSRGARRGRASRRGRRGAARARGDRATGLILVQTAGTRVGQVNGLAVYDFGDHRFGKVARITAAVGGGPGRHRERGAPRGPLGLVATTRA